MKKLYALCGLLLASGTLATPARAQYEFKDVAGTGTNGLGPYTQNFDALANTKANFISNTTLLGVYARYTLDAYGGDNESYVRSGTYAKLAPDDGSEGANTNSTVDADGTPHGASWYHFGSTGSTDRALGGIAATSTTPGKGYVGIRLKNSSSVTIKNLEIQYAMEQWYNSSQTQAATVMVDYQTSASAITSPIAGTWTGIPELGVPAPSTSTAIAPRNGNAATNRRVKQYTIVGVNLAAGSEIMIRFGYVFNSGTNGNGLSVDDIVITPETNIYYSSSSSSKNLDSKNSWGTSTDGSGTSPSNFTTANTTYYVQGNTGTSDRINGTWAVTGANSKIVVGTATSPAMLYVNSNDDIQGTVDVSAGSTLQVNPTTTNLTLGALHPTSTVEYINSVAATQNVKGASYGTLKLSGTGPKALTGATLVNTGLAFNGNSVLSLGAYDLLLLKGATLTGLNVPSTMFVTNGQGTLRRTVSSDGVAVLFPVGTSATSYTPVQLSQTQAQSEDTYGVRVADNTYASYGTNETGTGTAITNENVKKTWFVSEEVIGNSNITMSLQWNTSEVAANFKNTTAHVNHYTEGSWDTYTGSMNAATGTTAGSMAVSRPGITSFSPFGVSSRVNGTLPVQLVAFTARRQGSAVLTTWATASEVNSRDFTVERSADGQVFEPVGKVLAAGSASSARTYTFRDERPLAGRSYYRLRQTDQDNATAFSAVVLVAEGESAAPQPQVLPNPSSGQFVLLLGDTAAPGAVGIVRNVLGAEVLRVPLSGASAASTLSFDLSSQPSGLYLLQLPAASGPCTLRIVKQ